MGRAKILIMLFTFSFYLNAENIIDVYGTDLKQSEDLIKSHGSQASDIQSQFMDEIIKISNGGNDRNLSVILAKKNQLISNIQKQYDFSYVEFETVFYPGDKDIYTTIEVVRQNDKNRLQFIPRKIKTPPPTTLLKQDILNKMIKFQDISMNLILNNHLNNKQAKCPVYHCLPGFNHPELRDFFKLLTQEAGKEKKLLISTINNDPLSERITAAIYLTGFLNDPHEIISLLTPLVMNNDVGVRNSAMRVINETMNKSRIHEINVTPFINLLDSPFDTDRNKALLVLLNAANLTSSKQLIINKGDKQLISLLRLKQPNNNKVTYALLKKISNKDFGSNNADAWEKWFNSLN